MQSQLRKTRKNALHDVIPLSGFSTFGEFIDCCSQPEAGRWQQAWAVMFERYRPIIVRNIRWRCSKWNVPAVRRQFPEIVQDIEGETWRKLCIGGCRALRSFRGREDELVFLVWLSRITIRAADNWVRHNFRYSQVSMPVHEMRIPTVPDPVDSWDLYQSLVTILKDMVARTHRQPERDIFIFLLYTWGDFSNEMVMSFPLLRNIGNRCVDNIVHRLRKAIQAPEIFS